MVEKLITTPLRSNPHCPGRDHAGMLRIVTIVINHEIAWSRPLPQYFADNTVIHKPPHKGAVGSRKLAISLDQLLILPGPVDAERIRIAVNEDVQPSKFWDSRVYHPHRMARHFLELSPRHIKGSVGGHADQIIQKLSHLLDVDGHYQSSLQRLPFLLR